MLRLSHSTAAQAAAATALATIAMIGLPVMAEHFPVRHVAVMTQECVHEGKQDCVIENIDATYSQAIIARFNKIGKNGSFYDNKNIQTSSFDFPAYVSNTCFNPTSNDMARCRAEFGPYANLKETLFSGKLLDILYVNKHSIGRAYTLVPTVINQVKSGTLAAKDSYSTYLQSQQARASIVWGACQSRYPSSRSTQNKCFQANHRLITLTGVPVMENINYDSWMN